MIEAIFETLAKRRHVPAHDIVRIFKQRDFDFEGWQLFDDLTGKNVAGPPPKPLRAYDVNVKGDEIIVSRTS